MVHVLQHIGVSKPARSTVAEAISKYTHVALAAHDPLKALVYGYSEFVAVSGKYCLQVRLFSSNPSDEVLDLFSFAMLGRRHEHNLRPPSVDHAAVEALELVGDLVLPPAAFHRGVDASAKHPKAGLALLP